MGSSKEEWVGRGFWGESQARWATFWGSSRCWRELGTEADLSVRRTWGPDPFLPQVWERGR